MCLTHIPNNIGEGSMINKYKQNQKITFKTYKHDLQFIFYGAL